MNLENHALDEINHAEEEKVNLRERGENLTNITVRNKKKCILVWNAAIIVKITFLTKASKVPENQDLVNDFRVSFYATSVMTSCLIDLFPVYYECKEIM